MATARLFIWPASAQPGRADAVVVLSGDHGERLPRALGLIQSGMSSTLVQAGEPDSTAARDLCTEKQPFEVICLAPRPDNTVQEARAVGSLARARGWKTLIVVTSTQHVARAGLLFRRCVKGKVVMVGARPPFGRRTMAEQIAQEWLKLAYATVSDRNC